MSPTMVRWGGIMVFIGIALVFLIPIGFVSIVGLDRLAPNARGIGALGGQMQFMSIVMNIVMAVVICFVFYTTKGYFNAMGYHSADIVIYLIIGVQVLSAVLGAVTNTSAGLSGILQAGGGRALGVVGIVAIISGIAVLIALLIFSIFCISFGNLGGGIWKAIGILYIIGMACLALTVLFTILAVAAGSAGLGVIAGILVIVGGLVLLAAVIVHGIGLIQGAGKM